MINNGALEGVSAASLLEDLKSSEPKVKINAIRGVSVIAFALGKERTRNVFRQRRDTNP